ncbi:MAG: PHP domain-containing protein, partial [Firmicutes bacterium]|nr:PHP domain-containing protein [Bacillota bacterium]
MVSRKKGSMADMHLHSSISDGLYSPTRLVEICARNDSLKAIALTDHESTEGVEEAQKAGHRLGIEVIPGVEIGTVFQGREIHLLGYFVSFDPRLEKKLSSLRTGRYERMARMLALLSGKGIKVCLEDVEEEAGGAAPGRLHLARLLHKKGYVTTISEAFERFIGRGKAAYIPRLTLKIEEAISLLNSCGAVPVLAHPGITNENSQSLFHFKKSGLQGIEVYHPE